MSVLPVSPPPPSPPALPTLPELLDVLACPVCYDLLHAPRSYSCGHMCCQRCMCSYDRETMAQREVRSGNTVPVFSCPVCREETFLDCASRPICYGMLQVCALVDPARASSVTAMEASLTAADNAACQDNNLQDMCRDAQTSRAHLLYLRLRPAMFAAARRGVARVRLSSSLEEYTTLAPMLSKLVFEHGVHALEYKQGCIIVHILPETASRTYINNVVDREVGASTGASSSSSPLITPRTRLLMRNSTITSSSGPAADYLRRHDELQSMLARLGPTPPDDDDDDD